MRADRLSRQSARNGSLASLSFLVKHRMRVFIFAIPWMPLLFIGYAPFVCFPVRWCLELAIFLGFGVWVLGFPWGFPLLPSDTLCVKLTA